MKHFLIAFVFLCTWLYFGVRYYECGVKKLCEVPTAPVVEPPKVVVEKPITYLPFSITKNSETVGILDSVSNPLQTYFDYLNTNQREELVITSFFNRDEDGAIALLRGNEVKSAMERFGINIDRVVLQTKREDFNFSGAEKFEKGFAYEYQTMSEARMNSIDKANASKILYAGFGSKTFQPDNTLNTYALELKNYLAKHPNKQVEIIGHTDSNGDAKANVWFGKERAKSVMDYFVLQGIDASKLTISSKGETSPIATNATSEGQKLNRRIEINITN
ncbi:putative lipoprotein YiaD [Kordia antarctica]|uniref:Putative lipoprotein YiaD n=1 Tax=Kordia antarctica TaxID=1218801 RepID=A0A7L4ZEA1_9FLAO|nr:OmpA family protein [Kordia antarctica]QHI35043.1 putative lipoprotein YiaD [Kordia antarctica]